MPMPLSRTRTSTPSPRAHVVTCSTGRNALFVSRLCLAAAEKPLLIRFSKTRVMSCGTTSIGASCRSRCPADWDGPQAVICRATDFLVRGGGKLPQLFFQMLEVDWLGKESGGPQGVLAWRACGARHHHRPSPSAPAVLGSRCLISLSKSSPSHLRHVDVRQDYDEPGPDPVGERLQRVLGGIGKMQHIKALANLAAKVLTE